MSKNPYILLNKNINFNENETESTMENPTHSFRETNLVVQFIQESQIKSKKVMSFSHLLFSLKEIFLTFACHLNV